MILIIGLAILIYLSTIWFKTGYTIIRSMILFTRRMSWLLIVFIAIGFLQNPDCALQIFHDLIENFTTGVESMEQFIAMGGSV